MAEGGEFLIAGGHPPVDVWTYTPRQIAGYVTLATKRLRRRAAFDLGLHAMAARGEPKDLQKQQKELMQ